MSARFLPLDFGEPALLAPLKSTLQQIASSEPLRLAVGLSGGADSAMLAVHAAKLVQTWPRLQLHCFHIHHGLQSMADHWQSQVHELALGLGLPCHSLRVDVAMDGKGIEAAARDARYAGLARLAERTGVSHILLAHHLDDQS